MANPYRSKTTGRFSTQFETTSGFDPVEADGPNEANILANGDGVVPTEYAFPVKEPIVSTPTFRTDDNGRSTRSNPHARRAVVIDGITGQKVFDLGQDELERIAREKLKTAAGDSTVILDLVDPYGGR